MHVSMLTCQGERVLRNLRVRVSMFVAGSESPPCLDERIRTVCARL